jgi:hypothetical protein
VTFAKKIDVSFNKPIKTALRWFLGVCLVLLGGYFFIENPDHPSSYT